MSISPRMIARTGIQPILAGAEAGDYTLPAEITKLVKAEARLSQAAREMASSLPDVTEAERAHAERALTAVIAGRALPASTSMHKAASTRRERELTLGALRIAVEEAAHKLSAACRTSAEVIIVSHLRPALAELLEQARPHASVVAAGLGTGEVELVGDGARPLLAMASATQRYAAIRTAYDVCRRIGGLLPGGPADRGFASPVDFYDEVKRLDPLWEPRSRRYNLPYANRRDRVPDMGLVRSGPPWPTDPVVRLSWLIEQGAELWLPLGDEQVEAARQEFEGRQEDRRKRTEAETEKRQAASVDHGIQVR